MPSRLHVLKQMLQSVESQFDVVRIYLNGFVEIPEWLMKYDLAVGDDLTDNGKFYFLSKLKEDEYYFSCDDDIIYPPTYANDMVKEIEKHQSIVTHHGRIVNDLNVSYYRGHQFFHCANNQHERRIIDITGTGVTAFSTKYFKPTKIFNSENKRMSDIIFSLEAKKQNKIITVLPHAVGYIKPLQVNDSIYSSESKKENKQIELTNEIIILKKSQK